LSSINRCYSIQRIVYPYIVVQSCSVCISGKYLANVGINNNVEFVLSRRCAYGTGNLNTTMTFVSKGIVNCISCPACIKWQVTDSIYFQALYGQRLAAKRNSVEIGKVITTETVVPLTTGGRFSEVGNSPGLTIVSLGVHTEGPELPQYCAFEFTYKRQNDKRVKIIFFMCIILF